MSKISTISASMDKNMSPWSVEVVTPSDYLIKRFEEWDQTKSSASRLRSFNRARKWISNLLKRSFKVPEAHKLRHIDTMKALEHMINAMAMPGGVSYEDYLRSCLAPLPIQNETKPAPNQDPNLVTIEVHEVPKTSEDTNVTENNEEENFQDAVNGEANSEVSAETVSTETVPTVDLEVKRNTTEPETNSSQANTKPEVHDSGVSLNPICKSVWLGVACSTNDCTRAHPPRCTNPDCFVLDQGLPRWKTLQCRSWHGKPKAKPNLGKAKKSFSKSRFHSKANWPPLPSPGSSVFWTNSRVQQASVPVWQTQNQGRSSGQAILKISGSVQLISKPPTISVNKRVINLDICRETSLPPVLPPCTQAATLHGETKH